MNDYHDAIQNPHIVFNDSELKKGKVTVTPLGLPKVASGGFALTYRISGSNSNKQWAIRCFHKEMPDIQDRYQKISGFLNRSSNPYFVSFDYQKDGIRINNAFYPIIKMDWMNGSLLNTYVEDHLSNKAAIAALSSQFRECILELGRLGVAHGDLQHGNIMVCNDQLKLIDYDGMYVPGMNYPLSNELGHTNYQHPLRDKYVVGTATDRFSAIVIFIALEALQASPSLWAKYDNGENLLFRRDDFIKLDGSALLNDLSSISSISKYITQLKLLCRAPLKHVPTLEEFISGQVHIASHELVEIKHAPSRRQYEVFMALDTNKILARTGNVVEVVGKVTDVVIRKTKYGHPCAFINFGDYRMKSFCIVLWADALHAIRNKGLDINALKGKWISVVQLIDQYRGAPQFILEPTTKINILKNESEARQLFQELTTSAGGVSRKSNRDIMDSIQIPRQAKPVVKPVPVVKPAVKPAVVATAPKSKNQMILDQINNNAPPTKKITPIPMARPNSTPPSSQPKSFFSKFLDFIKKL